MIYTEIVATGSGIPERVVPNSFFSYLLEDADKWIHSRTGINERRFAAPTEATSDLATAAAKNALVRAGMNASELDCIIVATSTPDMYLPATACIVQKNIGADKAFAFDMNSVCSSFIFAVDAADSYIKSGKCKTIMVVGADTYSKILNFEDEGTSPLFGDGAGAVILRATSKKKGILQTLLKSDGNGWELIQVPSSGSRKPVTAETIASRENSFYMEGKKVFIFATDVIPKIIDAVTVKAGITPHDLDYIIPHQANMRIIGNITKRMGIGSEKFLMNLDRFGNTAAGSVGLVLDENIRNGKIKEGNLVLMMGFGGGLSWGGILLKI
ncbi:MAG: ketoacyl-ACP synthase III [Desulfuromonadales bacterium]|nr:ketoacyl-ACP synthase III [Desulfuromonadales bacterium]